MKKRITSILLVVVILSSLIISVAAAESRSTKYVPGLTFDDTTATCSISIMAVGKSIVATLELWQGSTRIATWSNSATSYLVISEKQAVTSGKTYTLKLSGTIDGEALTETSVTGTC